MQPFRASFRASLTGRMLVCALHALSAGVLPFLHGWLWWAALLLLPASAGYAWRVQSLSLRRSVRQLDVDTEGRVRLTLNDGSCHDARLLPGSVAHAYACLLVWQADGRRIGQCIWRDSTDGGSFRRIMVWARFVPAEKKQQTGVFRRPADKE